MFDNNALDRLKNDYYEKHDKLLESLTVSNDEWKQACRSLKEASKAYISAISDASKEVEDKDSVDLLARELQTSYQTIAVVFATASYRLRHADSLVAREQKH